MQSPDKFVLNVLDLGDEYTDEAAETHRWDLKDAPKTVAEYPSALESEGLVRAVAKRRLRPYRLFMTFESV